MESTNKTVVLNGMSFRVWEGVTAKGIPFVALVNRLEPADVNIKATFVMELTGQTKDMSEGMQSAFNRFGIVTGVPAGYGDEPSKVPPTSTGA